MKILLINDDGYKAEGIVALARHLKKMGEVTIVAPMTQMTGMAHSINMHRDLTVLKTETEGIPTFGVDSTPRDCAVLAINRLLPYKPDLLISGINEGANLGDDIIRSGTVGGASVGLEYGIPSIATSLGYGDSYDYDMAAEITCKITEWFMKQQGNTDYVLNLNIPNRPIEDIKGIRVCILGGGQYYRQQFEESFDGQFYHYTTKTVEITVSRQLEDLKGDMYAFNNGYITLSPLDTDVCRHQSLTSLEKNLEDFSL